jgi:hypothetical protein
MRITGKLGPTATFGMLILAGGMAGCSVFSTSNAPVCGELLISPESAIRHTHAERSRFR